VSNLYIKPMLKYIATTFFALLILPSLCFSTITGGKPKKPKPKFIFPEITFEIQSTSGSHSKEEIEAVANSELLNLRNIYYNYLNKYFSNFEGDVLLKFTIDINGKITKIDITNGSTGNAEFDKVLKNKIAAWKWNIKNSSATVTILFKFAILFPTHEYVFFEGKRVYIINGMRKGIEIERMIMHRSPMLRSKLNKYFNFKIRNHWKR